MNEARRAEDRAGDKERKSLIQKLTNLGCLAKEVDGVLIVVCPKGTRADAEKLTQHLDQAKVVLRDKRPIKLPKVEVIVGAKLGDVRPEESTKQSPSLLPSPSPAIRPPDAIGPSLFRSNRAAERGDVGGDVDNG